MASSQCFGSTIVKSVHCFPIEVSNFDLFVIALSVCDENTASKYDLDTKDCRWSCFFLVTTAATKMRSFATLAALFQLA